MSASRPGQPIGLNRKLISVTPTIDTAIYASGDALGGLLTFALAAQDGANSGRITGVTIKDNAKQSIALDLVLFKVTFTATADQAAFDPTDADLLNYIGHISVVAGDYAAFSDNSGAHKAAAMSFDLPSAGTSLFGQLVTRGTPTYVAATDITVTLHIEQD